MLTVILWMFMYGSPRDYVVQERFTSLEACEKFAQAMYAKKGTDVKPREHICFEDTIRLRDALNERFPVAAQVKRSCTT